MIPQGYRPCFLIRPHVHPDGSRVVNLCWVTELNYPQHYQTFRSWQEALEAGRREASRSGRPLFQAQSEYGGDELLVLDPLAEKRGA